MAGGRRPGYSWGELADWNATQLEAERTRMEAERDKGRQALEQLVREQEKTRHKKARHKKHPRIWMHSKIIYVA